MVVLSRFIYFLLSFPFSRGLEKAPRIRLYHIHTLCVKGGGVYSEHLFLFHNLLILIYRSQSCFPNQISRYSNILICLSVCSMDITSGGWMSTGNTTKTRVLLIRELLQLLYKLQCK